MELTVDNVTYKTSLRWLYGSKISKNDFQEFTSKHSNVGVYYKSKDFSSYGVLVAEDVEKGCDKPSLACAFSAYKSNAVIFMKLAAVDGEAVYWGCLISNGVPVIDFASNEVDRVINPIVKRLTDPGGDRYIFVESPSLLISDGLDDELDNNPNFNKLLFVRGGLNRVVLNTNVLKTITTPKIKKIKFSGGAGTAIADVTKLPKKAMLLMGWVLIMIIIYIVKFGFDSEQEVVQQVRQNFSIPQKDYTDEVVTAFGEYMVGNNHQWLISAYSLMGRAQKNIGPFVKERANCSAIKNECLFFYGRHGYRDYKNAIEYLIEGDVDFKLSLDANALTIKIPLNINTMAGIGFQDVSRFENIQNILYVRNDLRQRTQEAVLGVSDPEVITIGGKKGFFQYISTDLKDKLSFFSYSITMSGSSRSHLKFVTGKVSQHKNLLVTEITRDFSSGLGQSWSSEGEYLINIKEGMAKNDD